VRAIILRGVPGSGKSTWARQHYPDASVFSADSYFMRGGEFRFDPSKLGAAHAASLRGFVEWTRSAPPGVRAYEVGIADNTNTTIAEVAPYAAVALAYGHDLEIITFLCDPEIAAERNIHGVPYRTIVSMDRRLRASAGEMTPRWNHRVQECHVESTLGWQCS
jgi:predicted kinase